MIYRLPFVTSEVEGQGPGAGSVVTGASTALGKNGAGERIIATATLSCRARPGIHPSSIPSAGEFAARWTPAQGRGDAAFAEIAA